MRVVIALGGNAIAVPGAEADPAATRQRIREAASAVADIARGCEAIITHGNGPQVGLLAMQAQALVGPSGAPLPLDVIGAESEGMIGYLLEQELKSLFPNSEVATLLTQVEVDAADPAFADPQKPVGPHVSEGEAREIEARLGWRFRHERRGWRRVVPSPRPQRILEQRTIELLVEAGVLVVTAGGGGIPVIVSRDGSVRGVEAVVDKDRTAALLAEALRAERLLLLTDVDAVYTDWPEPAERALRSAPPSFARTLALDPGSMGPKLEAACRFVERTGGQAMIGSLDEARRVLQGLAGTCVRTGDDGPTWWDPSQ